HTHSQYNNTSLNSTHTQKHTHRHTHAHTHTHTHMHRHTHSPYNNTSLNSAHTHTLSLSHTHTHTHNPPSLSFADLHAGRGGKKTKVKKKGRRRGAHLKCLLFYLWRLCQA